MEEIEFVDVENEIAKKKALLEEAKALDPNAEWKDVAEQVMSLRKRFNRIHGDDSFYEENLNNEFEAVLENFYAKRRGALNNIKAEKEGLVKRAKELAGSVNFKAASEEFDELMNAWKGLGRGDKDSDDALWEEFRGSMNKFYDAKKADWNKRQENMKSAEEVKKELVNKAEALKNSKEWKEATEGFKNLLEEWKAAGRSTKEKDDELWSSFNGARDYFFNAKNEAFAVIKAEQAEVAKAKEALIAEAKELASKNEYTREISDAFKNLNVKWKEAGRAERGLDQQLWEQFRDVVDGYFNNLSANREAKHNEWLDKQRDMKARKLEIIAKQQKQINWLKNELGSTLSESGVAQMKEEIAEKEEFIKELEEQIKEIEERIEQDSFKK